MNDLILDQIDNLISLIDNNDISVQKLEQLLINKDNYSSYMASDNKLNFFRRDLENRKQIILLSNNFGSDVIDKIREAINCPKNGLKLIKDNPFCSRYYDE